MPLRLASCASCFALIAACVVHAEDASARPVVAGNHFVQPLTGEILGTVPGASRYDMATPLPGGDGRFRIGNTGEASCLDQAETPFSTGAIHSAA